MSRSPGGSSIDSPTRSVPVESESGKGGEGEIAGAEAGGELKGGAAEASRAADIDRLMQNASVRSFLANRWVRSVPLAKFVGFDFFFFLFLCCFQLFPVYVWVGEVKRAP